jgi:hypothetical protein
MRRGGVPLRPPATDQQQHLVPESATEWIASASIDDDWVSAKAMNLVTAMPRLAKSAATTPLVPLGSSR